MNWHAYFLALLLAIAGTLTLMLLVVWGVGLWVRVCEWWEERRRP